jgi:hypothetical protein
VDQGRRGQSAINSIKGRLGSAISSNGSWRGWEARRLVRDVGLAINDQSRMLVDLHNTTTSKVDICQAAIPYDMTIEDPG